MTALQVGDKVGSYEIVGSLGQGGMATVYKAYHERLDRHVALKMMHPMLLQDESFLARFQREAKIVARLEHPNIVPIYDYSENEGQPYLVMKFIEGPTLKRRALKTGLTLEQTARLMTDVAGALDYAHARDVLHRDMKPSNILLDMEDKPYITDFGLARIAQSGASTMSADMMLGTPYYISPEQAQGQKDLDSRTDVYAFGVILYELITGTVPFHADAAYAIVYAHIHQKPPPPTERNAQLPAALDPVLLRALAKNPTERYPNTLTLMRDFSAALAATPIELEHDSRAEPVKVVEPPPVRNPLRSDTDTPRRVVTDAKGNKVEVEGSLDLGSLVEQLGRMDWSRMGNEMKTRMENWTSMIEERIDSELKSRGSSIGLKEDEDLRILKRVEKRIKARQELAGHVAVYIIINLMLWGLWFMVMRGGFPWPFLVTMGWGAGLVGHFTDYLNNHGQRNQERVLREVEEERARERALRGDSAVGSKAKNEKAKHDQRLSLDDLEDASVPRLRLNDEGELSDSFVEENQQRGRRRGR